MERTGNLYARSLVDMLHDLAAGFFPGAVAATWLIRRSLDAIEPGSGALLGSAASGLWLIMILGLTASVITGVVRLGRWKVWVHRSYLTIRAQTIVLKHSGFVLVLVASAVVLSRLV